MFGWLGRFWVTTLGKVAGVTVKGWMVISAITTVTVVAAGVSGAAIVVHNQYQEARLVVITISGIDTQLTNCQYSGDTGSSPHTFLPLQRALEKQGFTNPYEGGCPTFSAPFSSGPRDIAEFSYASNPGSMIGGHWIPNSFTACDVDTRSLDDDSADLAYMIDAYRAEYPNARFALVGHSFGGLVALYGATQYMEDKQHAGVITDVITLDSPLHGRNLIGSGEAAAFDTLNELYASYIDGFKRCSNPDDMLGQALLARSNNSGNLAENEVFILQHAGVKVATLGNLDDCLYQQSLCFSGAETALLASFGLAWGAISHIINSIPSEADGQFVDGATQQRYHLGDGGGLPPNGALFGGHGAILTNADAINFIVSFLMPSVTSIPTHKPYLYASSATIQNSSYPATFSPALTAIDPDNGDTIWKQDLSGHGYLSNMVSSRNVLIATYVAEDATPQALLGISTDDGHTIWKFSIAQAQIIDAIPLISGNEVYAIFNQNDQHCSITALSVNSGAKIWQNRIPGQCFYGHDTITLPTTTGSQAQSSSPPLLVGEKIVISVNSNLEQDASTRSTVYALDATTGNISWQYHIANGSFYGDLVSDGSAIYGFAYSPGTLYALNGLNGKLLWSLPATQGGGAASSVDSSYVLSQQGVSPNAIFALNKTNGGVQWTWMPPLIGGARYFVDDVIYSNGSIALDETQYFDNTNATVGLFIYALQESSGQVIWQSPIAQGQSNEFNQFTVSGDTIVLESERLGTQGENPNSVVSVFIDAVHIDDGSPIWSIQLPGVVVWPDAFTNTFINYGANIYGLTSDLSSNTSIFALNNVSGKVLWQKQISTLLAIAHDP